VGGGVGGGGGGVGEYIYTISSDEVGKRFLRRSCCFI